MDFARFLHELQQGSELLYLTTQVCHKSIIPPHAPPTYQQQLPSPHPYQTSKELPLGPDDRPALTSPPITELLRQGDLPLRPSLLGHLVPQNLNLWMGCR